MLANVINIDCCHSVESFDRGIIFQFTQLTDKTKLSSAQHLRLFTNSQHTGAPVDSQHTATFFEFSSPTAKNFILEGRSCANLYHKCDGPTTAMTDLISPSRSRVFEPFLQPSSSSPGSSCIAADVEVQVSNSPTPRRYAGVGRPLASSLPLPNRTSTTMCDCHWRGIASSDIT